MQPSAVAFHPPASPTSPVVLACAGSGIAPFRGFLQDRALQAAERGVTPGSALLFFGCDAPDSDFRAGATVYVCGDGRRMAPGVHEICVRIYCEVTGANETDGLAWLDAMQREHSRYVPDVFV